jgi:hypothetical protein
MQADVLVHRMLEACISSGKAVPAVSEGAVPDRSVAALLDNPEAKFLMDRDQVAKCAQNCNAKKGESRRNGAVLCLLGC